MAYYSVLFLCISIAAAVLGFGILAGAPAVIAKVIFVAFLVLFLGSLHSHPSRRG